MNLKLFGPCFGHVIHMTGPAQFETESNCAESLCSLRSTSSGADLGIHLLRKLCPWGPATRRTSTGRMFFGETPCFSKPKDGVSKMNKNIIDEQIESFFFCTFLRCVIETFFCKHCINHCQICVYMHILWIRSVSISQTCFFFFTLHTPIAYSFYDRQMPHTLPCVGRRSLGFSGAALLERWITGSGGEDHGALPKVDETHHGGGDGHGDEKLRWVVCIVSNPWPNAWDWSLKKCQQNMTPF